MSEILCNWLNNDLHVSRKIDLKNLEREFSTGYLFGEVLRNYELQDDFELFSQTTTADSKLNNFTRLEPTFLLLGIRFDINIAKSIINEHPGYARDLLYHLYVALNKKRQTGLTGTAIETMKPAANTTHDAMETRLYKESLKKNVPRQADVSLDAIGKKFLEQRSSLEGKGFMERFAEQEKHEKHLQQKREELIQKYRDSLAKRTEMLAKIEAATVNIPKVPMGNTAEAIAKRRENRKKLEAQAAMVEIDQFEESLKKRFAPTHVDEDLTPLPSQAVSKSTEVKAASGDDYIERIRKKLNENSSARTEREKRRRKVLVEQMQAHWEMEEAKRKDLVAQRLMRQSQQERRIAVQLLQVRHEKDVIRQNRLMRERQYEERRLQEFIDALNREAEMARLAKLEYAEQIQADRELHTQLLAEKREAQYNKHYGVCQGIVGDIIDFVTKIGEYRQLTNKLLPAKLMREWMALFIEGKPLYTVEEQNAESAELAVNQAIEEEKQQLLDDVDFSEYRQMIGEWEIPSDTDIKGPPADNRILGHIIQRLYNLIHPATPPPPAPEFPPFPIKACIVGKVFAGKSTCARRLAEYHRISILNPDELIQIAVQAYHDGEEDESLPLTTSVAVDNATEQPVLVDPVLSTDNAPATPSLAPPVSLAPVTPAAPTDADNVANTDNSNKAAQATAAAPVDAAVEEGTEKGDAEKPISEAGEEELAPQLSIRAILGQRAVALLADGKAVDDQLIVDIITDAIRHLPEGTGWVIDGFPNTYQQAKMLEKALSGVDIATEEEEGEGDKKIAPKVKATKVPALVPDPNPLPPKLEPRSTINLVIMLDIDDELCLQRSAGRTYNMVTEEQYHIEFKPPPEGSMTGFGNKDVVQPVSDLHHDQDQVQKRLSAFNDTWEKLSKWYTRYGTLTKVDASQDGDSLYYEVENLLETTLAELTAPPVELPVEPEPPQPEEPPKQETPPPPPPVEEPPTDEGRRSRSASKKGSADKKGGKTAGKKASPGKEDRKSSGSRGSPSKSPKRSSSAKKGASNDPPAPAPEPSPESLLPVPGSDQWTYVDQPLYDNEVGGFLANFWDMTQTSYVDSCKVVFRYVRTERETIIRYFFKVREDFKAFLHRPDAKQEYVALWQKEFNSIPDDERSDTDFKANWHQRVDELRETLWNISDERKEQAEREMQAIMTDPWLDDQLGLLTNFYMSLMQAEVDRLQNTNRLLKDYYKSMEGKIPEEMNLEYIRLPLIEVPQTAEDNARRKSAENAGEDGKPVSLEVSNEAVAAVIEEAKPIKSTTPVGSKKSKAAVAEPAEPATDKSKASAEDPKKPIITLVARRATSADLVQATGALTTGKQAKEKPKPGSKNVDDAALAGSPQDPDERLLFDAYNNAVAQADKILVLEQQQKEAEEEAERLKQEEEKNKEAKGKKPKGKEKERKSSAKGKKKGTPPPATPPPAEETPEEKERKKIKLMARVEFFACLQEEVNACKVRLELIRYIVTRVLRDLKNQSVEVFKDLQDWLGARFLREMESIDIVSEAMRHGIESGGKIKHQLVLQQDDFLVFGSVKVCRTPSPVPPPPPAEPVMPELFTVNQIATLLDQLEQRAPSGMIVMRAFQEMLLDEALLSTGLMELPDVWMTFNGDKLEGISQQLSPDGEYVNWRMFLLMASQPWPIPSQAELLAALSRFRDMDQLSYGYLTSEQYNRIPLWFSEEPSDEQAFNRMAYLKKLFFDIFANHAADPPELDYVDMLLSFSVAQDPFEGFLRALSVAAGTHMPRIPAMRDSPRQSPRRGSRPSSQASLATSVEQEATEAVLVDEVPSSASTALVPLEALHRVLHYGQNATGDNHRVSVTSDPEDPFSKERLIAIYRELGSENMEPLPFLVLIEHPTVQDIIALCKTYRFVDLRSTFGHTTYDVAENQIMKVE